MVEHDEKPPSLSRSLGFWALAFYGIGDILGAGIYGLVGKVAGEAGGLLGLSFLLAMMTAGLTGLSYSELVSRHPQSAGESAFATAAFQKPWLSFLVGWLVLCSGVVSLSTVAHACGNYVQGVWSDTPAWIVWVSFVAFVSAINLWGIRQSSSVNIAFTVIEISGLLLVIFAGTVYFWHDHDALTSAHFSSGGSLVGVMRGSTLAFFAYIGFEDMVNVAEEVKTPARVFPKAIITAVAVCGVMYLLVGLACLVVIPAEELAAEEAPLLAVVRRAAPFVPPVLYTVVALVAVANTGLLNSIMASRLLYGMAKQRLLPGWLSAIHAQTRTPHWAVLTLAAISLGLIFSGTLTLLASTTSVLLLIVFSVVNISLLAIRLREKRQSEGFTVPLFVPVAGILSCLGLMFFVKPGAISWIGGIVALGILLSLVAQKRRVRFESLIENESERKAGN